MVVARLNLAVMLASVLALLLHSPFLFLFSFIYLPIWVLMVQAEERNLLICYGELYVRYWRSTGAFFPRRRR